MDVSYCEAVGMPRLRKMIIGLLASGLGGWRILHRHSAGYTAFLVIGEILAHRKSTCLAMPTLTFTEVSSSIVLMIGMLLEW